MKSPNLLTIVTITSMDTLVKTHNNQTPGPNCETVSVRFLQIPVITSSSNKLMANGTVCFSMILGGISHNIFSVSVFHACLALNLLSLFILEVLLKPSRKSNSTSKRWDSPIGFVFFTVVWVELKQPRITAWLVVQVQVVSYIIYI